MRLRLSPPVQALTSGVSLLSDVTGGASWPAAPVRPVSLSAVQAAGTLTTPRETQLVKLPIHSGADIHLADAFAASGCPLCRERDRTEAAYLESVLAESVNDVGFRQSLDAARGFCARHTRAMLDADRQRSGDLGAAILLRAMLAVRLGELEAAHEAAGRTRTKRVQAAVRPPACPACARVTRADLVLVESLVALVEEAAWAEAASAAAFCLEHLLALIAQRPAASTWPTIESRQLDRMRGLRDQLGSYVHASSHDRRHTLTDAQRASVDAAADLLSGPAPGRRDAGRSRSAD